MRIGNILLPHGLIVAPMAGISDKSFRRLCMQMGAEYSVSEMVCAKALVYEQKCRKTDSDAFKTDMLAAVMQDDLPMAIQIFGSEPEFIREATAMLVDGSYKGCKSDARPSAIDINMGCPVHKIVSNGEGSALMKTPELAGKLVEAAVEASGGIPVTAKIRAGWDHNSINAPEMARILESAGASAICVHGRTRTQQYSGQSDNSVIAAVKAAVKIPVIGNGDVTGGEAALRMISETECDGIMIGRAAIGDPFIFAEVKAALEGRDYTPPTLDEVIETALFQLRSMIEDKGERVGIAESRKHLCRYLKGFRGSSEARGRINLANTYEEAEEILRSVASQ